MKKEPIVYSLQVTPQDIIDFASKEEKDFAIWLIEAYKNKFITKWRYQPGKFPLSDSVRAAVLKRLSTKTKVSDKHLFHGIGYTPDFWVEFTEGFAKTFPKSGLYFPLDDNKQEIYQILIDTKGGGTNPKVPNNSAITFPLKQKWMYCKYKIYVNKVVPNKFFLKTWVPLELFYCKNRKVPTVRKPFLKGGQMLMDIIGV